MPAIELRSNVTIVRMGLEDLTAEIPTVGRLRLYRVLQRVQKRMRTPGTKPTYPIDWVSKKQMRGFYASQGFGRGIPTKRTNEYVKAWHITKTETGYVLGNPLPEAKFIGGGPFGGGQSLIHQDRWELFRTAYEDEMATLPEEVSDDIDLVARTRGFAA